MAQMPPTRPLTWTDLFASFGGLFPAPKPAGPPIPGPASGPVATTAWKAASQGQFPWEVPETQMFPRSPEHGDLTNFLRGLGSGILNMPQTIYAAANKINPLMSGAPTATPTPAAAPEAATPFTMPRLGARAAGPSAGRTISVPLGSPTSGGRSPGFDKYLRTFEGTGDNPRSSASGPGQFIDSTFMSFLQDRYPDIAGQVGAWGPKDRKAVLRGLKREYGDEASDWYRDQNTDRLAGWGLPVNDVSLALSHFLGPEGARRILTASPDTPVANLLDKDAIRSNPEVLSGRTAGEVLAKIQGATDTSVTPRPPTLPQPPGQALPRELDFSRSRAWADAAQPLPMDRDLLERMLTNEVLAQAAGGAASVDATKPGSFAAALGKAGAGASSGASQSQRFNYEKQLQQEAAERAYATGRSSQEAGFELQGAQREAEIGQVAFANAKRTYDTTVQNMENEYKWKVGERSAIMPQIKSDANGITIQRYNPATNSMEITNHPKGIFDKAEDVKNLATAMNSLDPAGVPAQAIELDLILKSAQGNPAAAMALTREFAIRHAVRSGNGHLFGKDFQAAQKEAQSELQRTYPSLVGKPEEQMKVINNLIASRLFNRLQANPQQWEPALQLLARSGNMAAQLSIGGMSGR